jgi:hypothetical protein
MKLIFPLSAVTLACAVSACSSSQVGDAAGRSAQGLSGAACAWTVVASPNIGSQDNVLGAVAGSAPDDVWAVGQYVQDSNPDFVQTLTQHFDGTAWSVVASPDVGDQANTLFAVTTSGHRAWATGYFIDPDRSPKGLILAWDGAAWSVVGHPHRGESDWLYGVAAISPTDVWAVGSTRDEAGVFHTQTQHFDGRRWSIVPSPNPGSNGNQLYGVTARGADDVWAVGQRIDDEDPDHALILHWNGYRWSVVGSEDDGGSTVLLYAVSGAPGTRLHAVGSGASNTKGARALALIDRHGDWDLQPAASVSTADNYLYSVSVTAGAPAWAVGTSFDPPSGNNLTLVEQETPAGWVQVTSPNPSSGGSNLLGGVTRVGPHDVWAVGTFDGADARQTLILHNCE